MNRTISAFHQDEAGDWVAELSCLHNQHLRHRPPFQERSWVLSEAGRDARLGTEIDCPPCDRAELPEGLRLARTAGPFDQDHFPPGLLRLHRVPSRMWARLRVSTGSVGLVLPPGTEVDAVLAGQDRPLPPDVPHRLTESGPVEFSIDLLERDPRWQ